MRKTFSGYSLIVIFFMLALHLAAEKFYWYVSIGWFDKFMHVLGGIFLAFLVGSVFSRLLVSVSWRRVAVLILLFVFIVGLGWEYFEYTVQYFIKDTSLADIPDSITDLLSDMIGGVIGLTFVLMHKRRYNRDNVVSKNS